MTARSTNPESKARSAKREDTSPKLHLPKKRGQSRAAQESGASLTEARKYKNTSQMSANLDFDVDAPLTQKQRLFVKFWAEGNAISLASRMAGYADSGQMAYRLVKRPNVLAIYEAEKKLYEEASQMTRKQVMDGLLEGIQMGKFKEDPMAVITGWREIGKMCGYYEPVKRKLDITVNGNIMLDRMNRMSDADLMKLIQEGVQEITSEVESDDE